MPYWLINLIPLIVVSHHPYHPLAPLPPPKMSSEMRIPATSLPFKHFLLKQLPTITEADPSILADYILALLKNHSDEPVDAQVTICKQNLHDFLGVGKTDHFVEQMFHYMMTGEEPRVPRQHQGHAPPEGRRDKEHREVRPDRASEVGRPPGHHRDEYRGGYREPMDREERDCRQRHPGDRPRDHRPPRDDPQRNHPGSRSAPRDYASEQGPRERDYRREEGFGGKPRHSDRSRSPGPLPLSSATTTTRSQGGYYNHPPAPGTHKRLLVSHIPVKDCNRETLEQYFARFGPLAHVEVNTGQSRAMIEFERPEDASEAFKCPDAVLGNRFVRMVWDRMEGKRRSHLMNPTAMPFVPQSHPQSHPHQHSHHAPPSSSSSHRSMTLINDNPSTTGSSGVPGNTESLQKLLDLQRQSQALLDKYIEQQKQLINTLSDPQTSLSDDDKQSILQSLKFVDEMIEGVRGSVQKTNVELARQVQTMRDQNAGRASPGQAPQRPAPVPTSTTSTSTPIPKMVPVKSKSKSRKVDYRPTILSLRPYAEPFEPALGSFGRVKELTVDVSTQTATVQYEERYEAEKVPRLG